jgi:hypothetical protein
MPAPQSKNSNLFAIDFDAIETILQDANDQLMDRSVELLSAFSRMPERPNVLKQTKRSSTQANSLNN